MKHGDIVRNKELFTLYVVLNQEQSDNLHYSSNLISEKVTTPKLGLYNRSSRQYGDNLLNPNCYSKLEDEEPFENEDEYEVVDSLLEEYSEEIVVSSFELFHLSNDENSNKLKFLLKGPKYKLGYFITDFRSFVRDEIKEQLVSNYLSQFVTFLNIDPSAHDDRDSFPIPKGYSLTKKLSLFILKDLIEGLHTQFFSRNLCPSKCHASDVALDLMYLKQLSHYLINVESA